MWGSSVWGMWWVERWGGRAVERSSGGSWGRRRQPASSVIVVAAVGVVADDVVDVIVGRRRRHRHRRHRHHRPRHRVRLRRRRSLFFINIHSAFPSVALITRTAKRRLSPFRFEAPKPNVVQSSDLYIHLPTYLRTLRRRE